MKFTYLPKPKDEPIAALEAQGHEYVALEDNPDLVLFGGGPKDFPDELPDSVKVVQIQYAGIEGLLEAGILAEHAANGVRFANAGGLYDDTVAESTLALLLVVEHRMKAVDREWNNTQLFKEKEYLFDNKKLALIGAGGIGKTLIRFLEPFGMEITAVNRSGNPVDGADRTVAMKDADEVWADHDYFVLLTPLTEETRHMVNTDRIEQMKDTAVVVNVGRGPLIDTEALTDALVNGKLRGAGLDVTEPEPLPADHKLWDLDNCVITPHTANIPRYMERRIGALALKNWDLFEAGETMATEVDVEAGY
ncbi:D-isomer specific 2-hydroxyacid dehydrogenase family protein [Corynebacterium coyleae]|uniref:D-isomer specific 2-hydroxyacid dehydrogenase family protein n=1 Tax=Corynebacterium coyleae TaxID=53374 RepID=UPI00254C2970|nr:D-isomer specific 2-hydroxyacid dehydrogenase family protein [Corynebacterium coyleae]MDK8664203.1 D-isomer specific 2-hydroxyacid dehydrogenase family protein [Corynebacterium coyleae]MDK8707255.1 D-isomer specific 2-hydroxyacid dehydrogenase family protein [Corynebacterium coyleae]MDK8734103.1 D-isomer specific 2-hydroxyacid dehydrogenase family protein [Corynebacterium coyleae]MDK8893299.1 D-isomer specific 2-hydroxyacid dehydrogenase family protein [Corynebacterium coyleae]